MKKIHILGAAVMALAMTACDNEPQVRPGSNEKPTEIAGKFIGITIKNADVNSRAITGPDYQEGTADENALADGQLHFLFFDAAGEPFPMTGTNINYDESMKDENKGTNWVKPVQVGADLVNNAGDVTKAQADAVLILGNGVGSYEGMIPSRVICVANVDDDFIKDHYAMKSIEELLEENSNAAASKAPLHTEVYTTVNDKKTNFVMTSSSWCTGATDQLSTVCWSDITYDNIADSSKDALKNPVNIYIERLAAKVSVTAMPESAVVLENATTTLEIQINEIKDGDVVLSEAKNVIAVPTGWDLNTVSSQTYGIKHLLDGKPSSKYFANASDFSIGVRSFWASTSSINQVQDFTPTNLNHKAGETIYTLANTKDPFLQGNGNSGVENLRGRVNFARCYATKVLVGVNLYVVDAGTTKVPDGMQPTEFMYWGGMYYTPEALCAVLGRGMEDGMGVAYARNVDTDKPLNYQVNFYAVTYKSGLVGKNISGQQASYEQMSVPAAECWSGMGYYIVNIANGITNTKPIQTPYMAAGSQMYGVLRNTSYNYEIEKFIGLGTPVPVTDDVTRVENPEETETYVAAKLNILNWRVLSTKVTLQ